jgi:subtilisin family serine protease
MAVPLEGDDTVHRFPRFYVLSWDRDGDGEWDVTRYPRFEQDTRHPGLQEHTFDLSADDQWTETVAAIRLVPIVYDDRIISPKIGGGYGRSGGTSMAAPVVTAGAALLLEQFGSSSCTAGRSTTPRRCRRR